MARLNPYLNFPGTCREALTFYQTCLGGDLTLQTVGESAIADRSPADMQQQIMHATLVKDQLLIMASDMLGAGGYTPGNNVALMVNCSSEEEINTYFNLLSTDGNIMEPLRTQFWGAIFGILIDKFGIRWMFNFDQKQE